MRKNELRQMIREELLSEDDRSISNLVLQAREHIENAVHTLSKLERLGAQSASNKKAIDVADKKLSEAWSVLNRQFGMDIKKYFKK